MSSSGGNTPARATNRSSTAWVIDGGNTPNFGFNATSTGGKAKGNLVFIRRTTYRGTKAILIVKSNAIDSLRSSGSLFPVTAMLSGKASYKIISLADGSTLVESGAATFTATVIDTGKSGGPDSFGLRALDKNGAVLVDFPIAAIGGGAVVAHLT
jgi:hypothetical protein